VSILSHGPSGTSRAHGLAEEDVPLLARGRGLEAIRSGEEGRRDLGGVDEGADLDRLRPFRRGFLQVFIGDEDDASVVQPEAPGNAIGGNLLAGVLVELPVPDWSQVPLVEEFE
jgi:hypothetical protein